MRIVLTFLGLVVTSLCFAQLASEPAAQPTNLQKNGNDKAWTFDIGFDASGADRYLVLRSTQPVSTTPVDGTLYEKGEGLGNAKVFSNSASSFIRLKEVIANTDYYFAIYAYNITGTDGSTCNYLTTNPLTGMLTSVGKNPNIYYTGIDVNSSTLISDLKGLINPHTMVDYDEYDETIVTEFFERDTVNGMKAVTCQYSNEIVTYNAPFSFFDNNYSREHRMPFSWINFNNITRPQFEETPEGNDLHALDLVNNDDVNFYRSNRPYSSDISNQTYQYQDFRVGQDSNFKSVAEIRDDRKGDAARALFYMMLAYYGKYAQNWGLNGLLSSSENQELSQLLAWHNNDPVDGFEIARHEYVFSKQNNRNPFIDFPELVDCIDFTDMTLTGNCNVNVAVEDLSEAEIGFSIYPQPAHTQFKLVVATPYEETTTLRLTDLSGRVMLQEDVRLNAGNNVIEYSTYSLPSGYYVVQLMADDWNRTGKMVIAK